MENKFKGLGVALVTPFQENGLVDFSGLQRLLEHQINGKTDYLVVQGTTGETPTLTAEEKRSVLDFVLEINNKRLPVVLGVGGNNTQALVETLETFDFTGVDAILSASPNYNKPTQEGIYQHYKLLAAHSPLPIILYNVPGRTSSNMAPETTLRLAREFKNIIAVKEASGNMEQIMRLIKDKPEDFLVISGDDGITLPMIASGGDGLISVIGNAFPGEYSEMVRAALDGDLVTARALHYKLFDYLHYLFVEGNPAGVKEVLKYMNICSNNVRLPLTPVSEATSNKLYALLAQHLELTS